MLIQENCAALAGLQSKTLWLCNVFHTPNTQICDQTIYDIKLSERLCSTVRRKGEFTSVKHATDTGHSAYKIGLEINLKQHTHMQLYGE